jgi:hypothetical protein
LIGFGTSKATKGEDPMSLSGAIFRILVGMVAFGWMLQQCQGDKVQTPVASSPPPPAPFAEIAERNARQAEAARQRAMQPNRDLLATLTRRKGREHMADMLRSVCEYANNETMKFRGVVREAGAEGADIYCLHQPVGSKPLTPDGSSTAEFMQSFVDDWRQELKRHQITRVGMLEKGASASGAWIDVN